MSQAPPSSSRIREENLLINHRLDFSGAYMGVKYIGSHASDYPFTITRQTLDALFSVFATPKFDTARQAFFLYHEAALILVEMGKKMENKITRTVVPRLLSLLIKSSGNRLRALSQALGRLADTTPAPDIPFFSGNAIPLDIDLAGLSKKFVPTGTTFPENMQWTWKGRSLIARTDKKILGVIKFATTFENIDEIYREAVWMNWFSQNPSGSENRVPKPVCIQDSYLFNITGELPQGGSGTIYGSVCIVFIPCLGYYEYPNVKNTAWDQIQQSFFKTALTLGRLSSRGLFHTALIPLFHNRVQQGRRNDNGRYLWEHAGRLDQWLDSSRFPNFAASGLRDFEHIVCRKTSLDLEHYTGEYLLSFILVAGSCFRNKAPHRRGIDNTHPHVNTRDLFCPDRFETLLSGVCEHYIKGLTGADTFDPAPFNLSALIEQLIEKMGLDEHMEEALRIQDQLDMDDHRFEEFLKNRGVTVIPAKGQEDIVLFTGPHLGGFNQPISIPKLIEFLFKFSAFCVASCFINKHH
ncbi:SidJ-related pseudokinase [uncultured Desulfobacter sp.]|uniref:SidJ-related pseudokinase n=1 Tax=uncultured Desulfobacter sp. TaxID=240139 RepID=UPI002AAAC430|nr:SidJ-related pseudokinase [uncultured Desulfobacter sp.]